MRALLASIYDGSGEELVRLRTREQRQRQLARVLGTPPSRKRIDASAGGAAWDVLINVWAMRHATTEQLFALATTVSRGLAAGHRYDGGRNRQDLRAWLGARNVTETLRVNVLRAFTRAYKTPQPVRTRGRGGERSDTAARFDLVGRGMQELTPYQHQRDAWAGLDRLWRASSDAGRRGLVVLPTGAGKTVTAVTWLVRRMADNPDLRVLWMAHQQELLEQAGRTFEAVGAHQPEGFRRTGRLISSGNSPVSTLRDDSLDVALVTWQSLDSRWQTTSRLLDAFLSRPTVVVVDEAHHGGAPAYQRILARAGRRGSRAMVGLTATPWPRGTAAGRMRKVFPRDIVRVTPEELHATGILATPVIYTIDTHEALKLTPAERRAARADLPPSVLRKLQTQARDSILLRTWTARPDTWGKTLVFATSTAHADQLADAFALEQVPTRVLHSDISESRRDVLDWFRQATEPCVLVSVGMLTEGVDLPDATTAFLARPTTSPILLRQMIGRVLRGPRAGGSPTANVVYLRDVWTNFDDVLEPSELPDLAAAVGEVDLPQQARALPPIRDDITDAVIGEDVLAQVARMYRRRTDRIPLDPATSLTRLCGYYATGERNVPVMEHQLAGYHELIGAWRRSESLQGRPVMGFFDDTYPPYPTRRSLDAVHAYVQSTGQPPPFVETVAHVDPAHVAQQLADAEPMTIDERTAWLRKVFEGQLARIAYRSYDHFEEAVDQQLRELARARRADRRSLNAERIPHRAGDPASPLPPLRRYSSRRLPALKDVVARMEEVLAGEEVLGWMPQGETLPRLEWTRRPISNAWAYWSLRTSGRAEGKPIIRINAALRAPATQISDDVLEYLVFHEMLHDLLPERGHDAEFRRLEAMWPESDVLDLFLDTLHERYAIKVPRQR